jgi:hypothetical protein
LPVRLSPLRRGNQKESIVELKPVGLQFAGALSISHVEIFKPRQGLCLDSVSAYVELTLLLLRLLK